MEHSKVSNENPYSLLASVQDELPSRLSAGAVVAVLESKEFQSVIASMLSFITYALSYHHLTTARVFSFLALFNSLRIR
jgi:hypothetical protein